MTGRVVFIRNTGKLCFATLQEGLSLADSGARLQVMLSLAEVGEAGAGGLEGRRRSRGLRLRPRPGDLLQAGRAVGAGAGVGDRVQGAAADAQPAHGAVRRDPGASAVRRPDRTRGGAGHGADPGGDHPQHPGDPAPRGLRRDRDPGAAAGARRGQRPAVQHPPERVRHRHDAADRVGAVPQAGRGRRRRTGLRARPDLPQRGHRLHPQRGVHHARGLSGLGRPAVHRRPDPADDHRRRRSAGLADDHHPGGRDRPGRRVAVARRLSRPVGRAGRGGHPGDPGASNCARSPSGTTSSTRTPGVRRS